MEQIHKGVNFAKVQSGLIVSALLWSACGLFIKWVPIHPLAISCLSSLLASIVIIAYNRKKIVINKRVLLGAFFQAATTVLFFAANKLTTAANTVILHYTSPVFTLILSAIFFKVKIKKTDALVVLLVAVGISLFFIQKVSAGGMIGNILALLSGVTYACMYIFCSACGKDAMNAMLFGHLLTFLVGFPFLIGEIPSITFSAIGNILVLGIFLQGMPSIIFASIMKHTTPVNGAVVTMLEPLLNPVWVFLGTGELPGTLAFIGGAIVIAAISLNIFLNKNTKRTDEANIRQNV